MSASRCRKWQCHKKVFADRIKEIVILRGEDWPEGHETGVRWLLDCGGQVDVIHKLIARGAPRAGDYYVRYDDGYESWSPAKAFEEGYTRIGRNHAAAPGDVGATVRP